MFSSLWGGGKKKDTAKDAIITLRAHIETLKKRETFLEAERDKAESEARRVVSSNKDKARDALKRKKRRETELSQVWGQMASLEQQLTAIEGANLNYETMKVMSKGAAAMKGIHQGLDMDKLDNTMDEIRDQVALGEEISDAISRPLHEADDAELEEELEGMEQEVLDAKMINVGRAPAASLPEVAEPAEPVKETEDEDTILRQLMEEMS